MNITELNAQIDTDAVGQDLYALAERLFPICRSITGSGVRRTLGILGESLPIEIHEVPSGTEVLDWTIPPEWNVREAWIKDPEGRKIVDFEDSSLHVVNYSAPVCGKFKLDELKPHLHSLPSQPDVIPYRTSYYEKNWGFCLRHKEVEAFRPGEYEVYVDSTLKPGHLTYGEVYLPGMTDKTFLISTHCCHPSLANDNLSGVVVAARLAGELQKVDRRYSYRFLFAPATIGAVTWLARNEASIGSISHGLVLSCLGDSGQFTYKKSRRGEAEVDCAVAYVMKASAEKHTLLSFSPYGYDERQYCSPGFNLPVGCFMRTPYGQFPEYHTSADNLDFISSEALSGSFKQLLQVIEVIERNRRYENLSPNGEPQLGKRGLYSSVSDEAMAMLWVLNLSDCDHTLLEIAERSAMRFDALASAADKLVEHQLLRLLD